MKAIIFPNHDNVSDLQIRLVAEGSNDRTLMRLLEQQYPTIVTVDEGTLEVPVVTNFDFPLVYEFVVCSLHAMPANKSVRVTSDPWVGAVLRDAVLKVDPPDYWRVVRFWVNGRERPCDAPCDVYPGTVVCFDAERRFPDALEQVEKEDLSLDASMVPTRL